MTGTRGDTSPIALDTIRRCRDVMAEKSKSFALASKLLPASCRDQIAVVYAFCRHVDDAIDLAPANLRRGALARLRLQVDQIFAREPTGQLALDAFAEVVKARSIPRLYVDELINGMEMDVAGTRYQTLDQLYLYAHRVAGVVGLLMCHVMGVSEKSALRRAAHLGIAMQLTNICRDVEEDLRDGRVYLPEKMLWTAMIAIPPKHTPERRAVSAAIFRLLEEAQRFYKSAEPGLRALPWRCALAVRAASLIYSAIGDELRLRGYDPFLGRAIVPQWWKLLLVAKAFFLTLADLPRRGHAAFFAPKETLSFPADVLPLEP